MKIRILFLALCMPVIVYSQSTNQNYIKETIFLNDKGAAMSKVDYYNGIGNLVESVDIGANGNNIYNFKMYDSKGREDLFYNPIPINSDFGFKNKEELKIASKDFYKDEFAYTKKSYDDADRLIKNRFQEKNGMIIIIILLPSMSSIVMKIELNSISFLLI